MASRIRVLLGSLLLYLAGKVIGGDVEVKVEPLSQVALSDIEDEVEAECQHPTSVKAGVMGRPLKRVCVYCKEEFDGSSQDGD